MIKRVLCPIRLSPRYRQVWRKVVGARAFDDEMRCLKSGCLARVCPHAELSNVLPTESTSCRRGVALRNDKGGRQRPPVRHRFHTPFAPARGFSPHKPARCLRPRYGWNSAGRLPSNRRGRYCAAR